MYKLCKTEQSASRQQQLEQGLLELMLQKPYEEISVSELCDRMDIPRKAFYRYFSSKDGALYALLDHTMLRFYTDGFRGNGGNALGDLRQFFLFWYDHRGLLEALERSHLSGLLIDRATNLAQQEKLMPRRIQSWPVDLQGVAMSFAVCGLISMVFQWHHQKYRISPEEITQVATSMLTKPLVTAPGLGPHTAWG